MRSGIVIGSYGQPDFARLNLAAIRHHCGDVPVLVCDDGSPHDLSWPGDPRTTVRRSAVRRGHYGGDLAAFREGLAWAAGQNLDVLFKLSQRFMIDLPRWDRTWGQVLMASGCATLGRGCAFHGFALRTEAMGLVVERWSPFAGRLVPDGRMPEHTVHDISTSLGGVAPWRLLAPARPTPAPRVLFREANRAEDYASLARRVGVEPGSYDCRESRAMNGYVAV